VSPGFSCACGFRKVFPDEVKTGTLSGLAKSFCFQKEACGDTTNPRFLLQSFKAVL